MLIQAHLIILPPVKTQICSNDFIALLFIQAGYRLQVYGQMAHLDSLKKISSCGIIKFN